jgi:GTPase SAR1 family protein
MYFKDSEAALIVYDITNELSFEKAKWWIGKLDDYQYRNEKQIMKFLVGNKCDMNY